jgi:beta-lactamase regulating signal transducer with metallopeptidase domain
MNETINLILSLSLSGSILAVIIFAVKPFIKHKISKSIQYYIWLVVLLRLIIPFSFEGSIMNDVFYGEKLTKEISSPKAMQPTQGTRESAINSPIIPQVEESPVKVVSKINTNYITFFQNLLHQYGLSLWLLGVIITLTINLTGYFRFSKHLNQSNKPATPEESSILSSLVKSKHKVKLLRNPFVPTPMLLGIIKPCIIIPDQNFDEIQLKNILLHEVSHLKRFDIGIKWLTLIATSIHWFNPLMYFIKKDINHGCELACDEMVIKNLSPGEKQSYGETLISVVSERKYPIGVLQATMCEEKKTLRERLVAIMNHNKKSKLIIGFSGIFLLTIIVGALYLGAGVGNLKGTPPNIYISMENESTKAALKGGYSWSYGGTNTNADTDHPIKFQYKPENILTVTGKQQLIIGTQKLKSDKKYNFSIEEISVYKGGQLIEFQSVEPSFIDGNLYISAPAEAGEYIYALTLKYKDRGSVTYGFVVRVDMLTYNLGEIVKYKTPYVGDNSKVSGVVSNLPVPDSYFKQQFISILSENKPYELYVFYEGKEGASHTSEWPIVNPDNPTYSNMQKNALVLFSMIDNLDKVTFSFRDSQSEGTLDTSKYNSSFTFSKASVVEKYGDLSSFSNNLDLLEEALTGNTNTLKENKKEISVEERKRMDLYIQVMKGAFAQENGGKAFVAVNLETLQGLSNVAKEEVLKELTSLSPNIYNLKDVKNDNTKFQLDEGGKLGMTIDGSLLWVEVEEYSESKAIITGVSWFGNLGAVFPKYEATYKNGVWQLKLIGMAIS